MDYLSVAGEYTAERTIEKSRFIAFVAHAAGEEAARAYLASVRKLHPLATHVCWAYISDQIGNLQRFSDDGEPQGTAGMPILGVLKAKELRETAIAVSRSSLALSTPKMGMPAVPCGSPSSEKRCRLPIWSEIYAQQTWVASGCSFRTEARYARAASSPAAWATKAMKRDFSMVRSAVYSPATLK